MININLIWVNDAMNAVCGLIFMSIIVANETRMLVGALEHTFRSIRLFLDREVHTRRVLCLTTSTVLERVFSPMVENEILKCTFRSTKRFLDSHETRFVADHFYC